ncbi:hypothetical protein V6N11_074103 [Hibiscus sabdariffa]|uniref:Uncharacterized protein n=2 Tax=Hibiscus sabdariffa TaxID=183260 RepID=A0ABR2CIW1_9ROSI
MVQRFINFVLLCLLFLMCDRGNAARDFNGKYTVDYLPKTTGDYTKDLEDNYAYPYFHKTTNNVVKDLKGVEMKDLEDKYAYLCFYKTTINDMKDDKMKDLKDDEMKDLEDKYTYIYIHKTITNEMKDLKGKYIYPYFHKSTINYMNDAEMKDLEDKYTPIYIHKTITDYLKENEMKDLKGKSTSDEMEDESAKLGLFTLDQLRGFSVGKKMPIFFPIKDHSLYPPSLPKEVADTIPFSSSQVSNILHLFSVSPDSPKAKAVQGTLKICELEAAEGETKVCATSLESLHGFLSNVFGPDVDFKSLSTRHPTMTTPILQNYTVLESPREIESPKKVACHPMPYLYAVYFCHFDATETKAFKFQLVGDITGDKVDAVVLSHMDTSGWSSDHVAFRMLGIKLGDVVCHVFSQGNVVWINQPSANTVRAA